MERHFSNFAKVEPRIVEALLVPFHVGGVAVGTIWVSSRDGSKRFDAEDARVWTTQGEWMISVADNGPGFDPHFAAQIFLPFKRLHGSEVPGSGIALATCKRIVERLGGRIWAEATPGKGATFYFTLPDS